jgi:hypothetical protein
MDDGVGQVVRQCLKLIVVTSALCADFEPQAQHYTKLRHNRLFRALA